MGKCWEWGRAEKVDSGSTDYSFHNFGCQNKDLSRLKFRGTAASEEESKVKE